jgi:hypothetical protein
MEERYVDCRCDLIADAIAANPLSVDHLIGYDPTKPSNLQFVVGRLNGSELWLIYATCPPQTDRVSALRSKFLVFGLHDPQALSALADLWLKTSRFHEVKLEMFSLMELGIK